MLQRFTVGFLELKIMKFKLLRRNARAKMDAALTAPFRISSTIRKARKAAITQILECQFTNGVRVTTDVDRAFVRTIPQENNWNFLGHYFRESTLR